MDNITDALPPLPIPPNDRVKRVKKTKIKLTPEQLHDKKLQDLQKELQQMIQKEERDKEKELCKRNKIVCDRCGKKGHDKQNCYETTDIHGNKISYTCI